MLVGSFMAIIHSVIPAIFKTGASTKIKDLYIFTQERLTRNKKKQTPQKQNCHEKILNYYVPNYVPFQKDIFYGTI